MDLRKPEAIYPLMNAGSMDVHQARTGAGCPSSSSHAWALNNSRRGDLTVPLCKIFHCATTLSAIKVFFHVKNISHCYLMGFGEFLRGFKDIVVVLVKGSLTVRKMW